MKCPFCKQELKRGENRRFTNTSDHVFDPNGEHERPLRSTFVCNCEHSFDCFWDDMGGFYGGPNETLTYSERKKLFPSRDCWPALGSWEDRFSRRNAFRDKVYELLFFARGNDRFFLAEKIARFVYGWNK